MVRYLGDGFICRSDNLAALESLCSSPFVHNLPESRLVESRLKKFSCSPFQPVEHQHLYFLDYLGFKDSHILPHIHM